MKPALRNGMIVGLIGLAGVTGWSLLQLAGPSDPDASEPGTVVIVERQPAGQDDGTDQVAAGPAPAAQPVDNQSQADDMAEDAEAKPEDSAEAATAETANAEAGTDLGSDVAADDAASDQTAANQTSNPQVGVTAAAEDGTQQASETAEQPADDADAARGTTDDTAQPTATQQATDQQAAEDTADPAEATAQANAEDATEDAAEDAAKDTAEQTADPAADAPLADVQSDQAQAGDGTAGDQIAGDEVVGTDQNDRVDTADDAQTPGEDPDTTVIAALPADTDDAANNDPAGAEDRDPTQDTPSQNTPSDDTAFEDAAQPEDVESQADDGAPRFDIVRVDQDGQAVVAGRAEPGTDVEILLDGKVVGTARTDGAGAFVTVIFATLSGDAQSLQLRVAEPRVAATAPSAPAAPQPATPEGVAPQPMKPSPTADAPVQPDAAVQTPAAATGVEEPALPVPNALQVPLAGGTPIDQTRPAIQTPDPNRPDRPVVVTTLDDTGTPVAAAPSPPDAVGQGRYRVSAPIIILPGTAPDAAPTLVQPNVDDVAVLQPSATRVEGVVLDRITYSDAGDVQLQGRGRAGRAVRIYGNGLIVGTTQVAQDGTWSIALDRDRGKQIKLFRFDEVNPGGGVDSRIETPFTYSSLSPQVVRERRVVVQRGDVLWRIAEQFYGEGIRYSLIYGANDTLIRDPDLIYPGQVFSIPELVDAN